MLMRSSRANSCALGERSAARKSKYWYLQRLVSEVAVKQKRAVEIRTAKESELNYAHCCLGLALHERFTAWSHFATLLLILALLEYLPYKPL